MEKKQSKALEMAKRTLKSDKIGLLVALVRNNFV